MIFVNIQIMKINTCPFIYTKLRFFFQNDAQKYIVYVQYLIIFFVRLFFNE